MKKFGFRKRFFSISLKRIFPGEKGFKTYFLFFLLSLAAFSLFAQESKTVVKIENAQKTEYRKNEETGEDEIVLSGAVSISVTNGNTVTTINASRIVFNRATNMVYADGAVSLKQTGGSGTQDISADTLLFNTETMEGVFDNGKAIQSSIDAINLPSGSQIFVSSEMFGRDSSQTIAFKNATMTFCDEEDPHWKIWASKIWLLPGGEFAFLNAVLFVGQVPIMYLPAFYYPKDELVFNPSFGYDRRKGWYFNSTTYLIGRKPLDVSSGASTENDVAGELFSFMKSNTLKEQKREGLVLHNLENDFTGDTSTYLKIMADYYTNLGGMIGVEGSAKPFSVVTDLHGFFDIGFSRTIFYDYTTDSYMPYSSSGKVYNDGSDFLGLKLPFRYAGSIDFAIANPFSFRLTLPFYSDPFFKSDFGERSEYMDWIGFLTSGASSNNEQSVSTVSSFSWNATASYSIPVPEKVKPYISSSSVSASSSIIFGSMNASLDSDDNWKSNTPERLFYYPSQVIPLKLSGSISGTIYSYKKNDEKKSATTNQAFEIPLTVPDEFAEQKENQNQEIDKTEPMEAPLKETDFPFLDSAVSLPVVKLSGLDFNFGYSCSPQLTSQLNFDPSSLTRAEDFRWDKLKSSYLQLNVPASITGNLSYRGDFLSVRGNLNFNSTYQTHPILNGYVGAAKDSVLVSDYSSSVVELSESGTVALRPFIYNDVFKNTSISWNNSAKLLKTKFVGTASNPEWEVMGLDVTDEKSLTAHSLSTTVSAVESSDFSQSLTFTSNLPPQNERYSLSLNMTFPFVTASISGGISETKGVEGKKTWTREPLNQSLSASLFSDTSNKLTLSESFSYNLETFEPTSLRFSLNWKTLSMSYSMANTYGYDFDESRGWEPRAKKEFLPVNVSLNYSLSGKKFAWSNDNVVFTPSFSTSVVYDCLRPTNSYFSFTPSFTFKISDALNLTFSSESKNSVIYRYFQGLGNSKIQLPGETNVFVDLLNSFAFWSDTSFIDPNQSKRKSSGFKLKSLKVTATHSLHDWDLSASFSVSPRLVASNGIRQYNFDPYISLSVAWKPMSSMKAEVVDKYGEWQINP